MNMLAALLIGAIALYLLLAGLRFARTAISLWGLVVGFLLGSTLASDILNVGSLGTKRSIFLGLAVGIFCAIFAYVYYGFAVVALAGGIGYWLGGGFLLLLGFVPGTVSAIGGLAIGVACAAIVLITGVTKYMLILLTSIAGSASLIGAILVLFHKFGLEALSYISVVTGATSSMIWLLTAIAFTAIGVSIQTLTTPGYECEKWTTGNYRTTAGRSGVRTFR